MKRILYLAIAAIPVVCVWLMAQPAGDPIVEGLRLTEVASVADATEQLYGQKTYMSHDMRPLAPTKFAGPAVTVLLKKGEHKDGAAASQGMQGMRMAGTSEIRELHVLGDWAYPRNHIALTITPPGGEPVREQRVDRDARDRVVRSVALLDDTHAVDDEVGTELLDLPAQRGIVHHVHAAHDRVALEEIDACEPRVRFRRPQRAARAGKARAEPLEHFVPQHAVGAEDKDVRH